MTPDPQIGSFRLIELLGEGGMGRVYRAVHDRTGVDVALKVLSGKTGRRVVDWFHREVQAHAGLVHPGIVYLFDYGEVDDDVGGPGGDVIQQGSPFVAMELADRATVRDMMPVSSWATVRELLMQVLDALAFAHARGVIHRDLKPENLLVFQSDSPLIKLADFGLAHALEDAAETDEDVLKAFSGTPLYMAPEQLRSRWREYGPWTDLYAVGCIAWELVCGRRPFGGRTPVEIAMQHLEGDRPQLEPQFPVPDEFQRWVERAIAVDTDRRFRRAADAAWALEQLPEAAQVCDPVGVGDDSVGTQQTISNQGATWECSFPPTISLNEPTTVDRDDGGQMNEEDSSVPVDAIPPLPETWELTHGKRLPTPLAGTGLGLFGLREVPLVNRDDERRALWSDLRDVVDRGQLRVTVLFGEAGVGKSQLAKGLATRAHETGASRVIRAVHTASKGGTNEGLAGLISRLFRLWKMSRRECYEALVERLPPLGEDDQFRQTDARALTELVHPIGEQEESTGPRFQFSGPDQRNLVISRLLRRTAKRRSLLLWFDDVHWGDNALSAIEHLVEHVEAPLPVHVVATVRSDIAAERTALGERLEALVANDRCRRLDLTPLESGDHRRLLELLLPLEPALADRIEDRTEGNPLFAHQLLGEWIAEGTLEIGDGGFVVGDEQPVLPDDIHELWMTRLSHLVDGEDSGRRLEIEQCIELAAVLGREVADVEWREVCQSAGLTIAPGLVDEMIELGLAKRVEGGWAFTHGLLVDSIQRHARGESRWRDHHRRCARMLEKRAGSEAPGLDLRRADHWVEAGEPERALQPLFDESRRLFHAGEPGKVLQLLRRRQRLLDELKCSAHDRRWLENEILTMNARFKTDAFADRSAAIARVEDLVDRCHSAGYDELTARACNVAAIWVRGDDPEASKNYVRRAVEYADRAGDGRVLGLAWLSLGWKTFYEGNTTEAKRQAKKAKSLLERHGRPSHRANVVSLLGWIAISRGAYDRAMELFGNLVERAEERGDFRVVAEASNGLGDAARFGGHWDRARRYYRRFLELKRERGNDDAVLAARINLLQTELAAGDVRQARQIFEGIEVAVEAGGGVYGALLKYIRLALSAGVGNWRDFDRYLRAMNDEGFDGDNLIRDYPWVLELGAEFALKAGERRRTRQLLELAGELWERLGDEEKASEVGRRISDLGDSRS